MKTIKSNKQIPTSGTGDNTGFELEDKSLFGSYLDKYNETNELSTISLDDTITGTLISRNEKYSFIDIKNKSNVIIENSILENSILDAIEIGSDVEIIITEIIDKKEYLIYGSAHKLKMIAVQDFLTNAFYNKDVITGIPTTYDHAGYTVQVNINDQNISLFMPHLLTDVNKLPNQDSILDCEIEFLLDLVEKNGNKSYIASRKAHLLKLAQKEIKNIKRGNIYTGHVTGVTDFAIFIQFNGCLTGMIHKTNLTEQAQEMLENGQISNGMSIEFYVKDIDVAKTKVFLTQELRDSLWDTVKVDQKLDGKVVAIKDFGLLVSLDYETKGLLHESVLDGKRKFTLGETVSVVVTNVNKNKRQITLNLC